MNMQKKYKLLVKVILLFVVILFVNLFFKLAPAKAAEIGCCHITQPSAGDTTYQCWNTRPENCSSETGVTILEYIPKIQTCNLISECAGAIQPPVEAICDSTGCRDQSGGTPPVNVYGSPIIETPPPNDLENRLNDLNARKPILQINIPGLNFSNVASTTDETGTYFYISWIPELISALYKFGIAIVSIVGVVMIIIQGITIASGGFISKTIKEGGKDVVISAYKNIGRIIVGLMIAWGSFAILYNVNPALVQFNALKVQVVKMKEFPVSTSDEDPTDVRTVDTPGTGKVPYFAQFDPRWGNLNPGDPQWPINMAACKKGLDNITNRGCGPTSMAMVLKYLGKDVTPIDTAKFALGCSGGMSAPAVNKNWSKGPWSDLKFEAYINSDRALALAIQNIPLILGCRPCIGYTTDGKIQTYSAHYMVITGSNDGGVTFSINDPGARKGIVKMTRDQMLNPQKDQAVQGCNFKSKPDKRSACINGLKEMRKPNFYYIHK